MHTTVGTLKSNQIFMTNKVKVTVKDIPPTSSIRGMADAFPLRSLTTFITFWV